MTKFEEIKTEVNKMLELLSSDADKFYNKNQKAAGVRLRKHYKTLKQYIDSVSKETIETKENK
jgi:hypothetical protein